MFAILGPAGDVTPGLRAQPGRRGGHRASGFKLFPKKFRGARSPSTTRLMEKLGQPDRSRRTLAPGPDTLSRFLKINCEMRRKKTSSCGITPQDGRKGPLARAFHPRGKEESLFADARNYIYKGNAGGSTGAPWLRPLRTMNAPVLWPTTAAWCGRATLAFTEIVWWWITGTRCNRSTATEPDRCQGGDLVKRTRVWAWRARPAWPAAFLCTSACRSMACGEPARVVDEHWIQDPGDEQTGPGTVARRNRMPPPAVLPIVDRDHQVLRVGHSVHGQLDGLVAAGTVDDDVERIQPSSLRTNPAT